MAELRECPALQSKPARGIKLDKQPAALPRLKLVGFLAALLGNFVLAQIAPGQSVPVDATPALEQAIALLTDARLHFQNVQDYECRLLKRERVNGVLLPECVMTLKVRKQPFSVYLRCESPDSEQGQEVCFVDGRNQKMMRVHPAGLLGIVGFV